MSPKNGKESKQMWERICPECDTAFQSERVNKRFCKDICRVRAWQKKYPRVDPQTGEVKRREAQPN